MLIARHASFTRSIINTIFHDAHARHAFLISLRFLHAASFYTRASLSTSSMPVQNEHSAIYIFSAALPSHYLLLKGATAVIRKVDDTRAIAARLATITHFPAIIASIDLKCAHEWTRVVI